MAREGWDITKPNPARIYDYFLGGKDNLEVDRQAAEELARHVPLLPDIARANRQFLGRAVTFLADEAEVDQFIDIGTGFPGPRSVHEVAREHNTEAKVVYVDNDPVVIAHNRALLALDDKTLAIEGDVRDVDKILANPELTALIDFSRPVAVLALAVLHFVSPADDPHASIAAFRDTMAPGSYLAVSHGLITSVPEDAARSAMRVYDRATEQSFPRTREEIARFFDGFELVEPGLVPLAQWRATDRWDPYRNIDIFLGGVGRKP